MSPTWLDQLEQNLEERLDAFLHSNPDQDRLLQEQHLQDRQRDLRSRRDLMQIQARDLRRQLLSLAEQVQAWGERTKKARDAGADDLALRAEQHVKTLMDQGRDLWNELDELGRNFRDLDQQISRLNQKASQQRGHRSLDEDWALFEAQQELEDLRRRQGLS
ncbi:hercynine metabolism protein [Synechococcus sp. GEYO]|uniref:hercynine metabolism protein n=1 Tax=Synechococcus sp. GEYO TaxID=2575511 RepID=UPI000E0E8BA9|nr:hercynine metabolism protein [Synechococcus sp. GEYO]